MAWLKTLQVLENISITKLRIFSPELSPTESLFAVIKQKKLRINYGHH